MAARAALIASVRATVLGEVDQSSINAFADEALCCFVFIGCRRLHVVVLLSVF